jgi:hypothetical protein
MHTVLATAAPLVLVVPDDATSQMLSVALRLAHDLNVYHKLDSEIIQSSEAMQRAKTNCLSVGNMVVIGDFRSPFSQWCFSRQASAFDFGISPPRLNGQALDDTSRGMFEPWTY